MEKQVVIIHPYDKSTKFLNRIKNYLQSEKSGIFHYYSVKPNELSHKNCINLINDSNKFQLVVFMGHGRSDCLYGAKGDYYGSFENLDVKEEFPEKYFYDDSFINESNLKIFNNKKIISLSCNSNGQIGEKSIESGAKVFLGFGNIPSSVEELKAQGEVNKIGVSLGNIEKALKSEINDIIKKSISIGVREKYSFSVLIDFITFLTNQKISYYLMNQKKVNERKLIANYLYTFKNEMKIFGNKDEILIN